MSRRGKIQYFPWGNTQKSITELLEDPKIYQYVLGSTYASKREAIRKLLREGRLSPSVVDNLPSTTSTVRRKGQVLSGPLDGFQG